MSDDLESLKVHGVDVATAESHRWIRLAGFDCWSDLAIHATTSSVARARPKLTGPVAIGFRRERPSGSGVPPCLQLPGFMHRIACGRHLETTRRDAITGGPVLIPRWRRRRRASFLPQLRVAVRGHTTPPAPPRERAVEGTLPKSKLSTCPTPLRGAIRIVNGRLTRKRNSTRRRYISARRCDPLPDRSSARCRACHASAGGAAACPSYRSWRRDGRPEPAVGDLQKS